MYCTVAQARAAGATGTDAEVTAAILAAQQRVDRFTSEIWETRPATTVRARFRGDGLALLPRRVQTVDSVTYAGSTVPLGAAAYRVRSSAVIGDVDAVEYVSGMGSWNDLVVGAERWNGGWANLGVGSRDQVLVVGTFGHETTPAAVAEATALLAASIRTEGGEAPEGTDAEGNASGLPDPELTPAGVGTGLAQVDDLLRPYRRQPLRVG